MPAIAVRLKRRLLLAVLPLSLLPGVAAAAPWSAAGDDGLLPVARAFVLEPAQRSGDHVDLRWTIAPGYYLYRARIHVEPVASQAPALPPLQLPRGLAHDDAEAGRVEIYREQLLARQKLPNKAAHPLQLRIRYQGCADRGVCYPPQTIVQTLP